MLDDPLYFVAQRAYMTLFIFNTFADDSIRDELFHVKVNNELFEHLIFLYLHYTKDIEHHYLWIMTEYKKRQLVRDLDHGLLRTESNSIKNLGCIRSDL